LDEPEHTNVFRYISESGFEVYNWKLDDERILYEYRTYK